MAEKPLPLLGSMDVFNPDVDDWSAYVERLELFFVANNVKNEKKVAVLVIAIGTKLTVCYVTLSRQQKPLTKLTSNW